MNGAPSLTTRQAILALTGGCVALAVIVLALFGWRDYRHLEATAMAGANSLAAAMETEVERTVTVTDRVLATLQEQLELNLSAGFAVTTTDRHLLVQAARILPMDGTIWFIAADGTAVLSSVPELPPGITVTDREYFPAHRSGADFYLSRMTKGRLSQRFNWLASRRVNAPDGSFAGVVAAAINLHGGFQTTFQVADLGPDAAMAVLREDGGLVMRYPMSDKIYGKAQALNKPPAGIGSGRDGSFRQASPIDGVVRLGTWRRLQSYPLIVAVSVAAHNIEVVWVGHMAVAVTLMALMLIPLLLFARTALTLAHREQDQRDRLEETVAARTGELRRAIAAKDRFLASASHDLRQPMQAIRLLTDVLRTSDTDPARERMVWPHLDRAIEAGETLLGSLLEVSSLDANTTPPRLAEFAVYDLLADVVEAARPAAKRKGLRLDLVPSRLGVTSDPALLRRMLANLLCNSVRYTERGRILVGCRRHGDTVRIEVWDTGIGIAADKLGEVFEDFVQVANTERDRAKGLGLGLGIVRRAALLLGHRLSVRSAPGRGSVFAVEVPRAPGADQPAPPASHRPRLRLADYAAAG